MAVNQDDRQRANWAQLKHFEGILKKLRPKVLRSGFHGNVWIEIKIQDGIIQHTVARVEESMK